METINITLDDEGRLKTVLVDGKTLFDEECSFNEKTGTVLKIELCDYMKTTVPIKLETTVGS